MLAEVLHLLGGIELHSEIATVSPGGKHGVQWDGRRLDDVTEWLEDPPENGLPASAGHHRQRDLEWHLEFSQLRTLLTPSAHCRREVLGERDRHERRGHEWPVIDVLGQREVTPAGTSSISNKADRIDVHHQGHRAALLGNFGVHDMSDSETELHYLMTLRVLVQQEVLRRKQWNWDRRCPDDCCSDDRSVSRYDGRAEHHPMRWSPRHAGRAIRARRGNPFVTPARVQSYALSIDTRTIAKLALTRRRLATGSSDCSILSAGTGRVHEIWRQDNVGVCRPDVRTSLHPGDFAALSAQDIAVMFDQLPRPAIDRHPRDVAGIPVSFRRGWSPCPPPPQYQLPRPLPSSPPFPVRRTRYRAGHRHRRSHSCPRRRRSPRSQRHR